MLVFHGEGTVREREAHLYEPGIRVEFNEKAYNNTNLMLKQLNEDIAPYLNRQQALIVLDCVLFHKTELVKQIIQQQLALMMAIVPPGYTPCCQPLDVSFNYPYKGYLADYIKQYKEQFDLNYNHIWTTSERRVLLTKATGYARRQMETVCSRNIIQRAFTATGILISPMGDENAMILIKDAPNWSFEGWRERERQYEETQVKQEDSDEEYNDLDTRLMGEAELQIYFGNYNVKKLTVLCKMRGIKGYTTVYRQEKKRGLIRLLVDDFQRVRTSGACSSEAININVFKDSDIEVSDDDDGAIIDSNVDTEYKP
ncbi:hypothetical protein K469DRAFT_691265 [Zopfia rhizophila CBS 207.26]|uniref:DDE-1 domain-containing protein n=1 Tax=Zopfia rhizophila CBS 207.26 TaxID=1314779 RepID=A0A6A6ERY1_9PEZI|nr:hypothetical protein K469DRAFT_691265 [Zopfia rhizophila CBS 207.26]